MKKKTNQYGDHFLDKSDIESVVNVLKNKNLTSGSEVTLFEKDFSKTVKSKYALSCINGTAAIHLALLTLNLNKEDLVIVPSITFVATYNAVLMAGAKPIIADVDGDTGLIKPENVDELMRKFKKKVKAIIVVHLNGNITKLNVIKSRYRHLKIIEDSCHALGSTYTNKKKQVVGDCMFSDFCTFSFHPVKNITTGEGGMVTTNNKKKYEKLKLLRSHYLERLELQDNSFPYTINDLGYNYRLTDIQCALGRSQLKKLNNFKKYRKKLVGYYLKNFSQESSYIKFVNDNFSDSFWHLFVIKIDFQKKNISRKVVMKKLKDKGIASQIHYIPLHKHNYIKKKFKFSIASKYSGADNYYSQILTLPLHMNLNSTDINYISKELLRILGKKTGKN